MRVRVRVRVRVRFRVRVRVRIRVRVRVRVGVGDRVKVRAWPRSAVIASTWGTISAAWVASEFVSSTYCLLFTAYYRRLTTDCLLLTTDHSLLPTN